MNERTYRILEFDKILQMLSEQCVSSLGSAEAERLTPSVHRIEVVRWQQETSEAYDYLMQSGVSPVHSFDDITASLNKARIDGMLQPKERLACRLMLAASRGLRRALLEGCEPASLLGGYAAGLISEKPVEDEIERCILGEDEIADAASPELYRIRRDIKGCHARIRDRMNRMIHSPQYAKYLQNPIITMRNDRYVIPVRAEYRANVPGLIHDQSGSGATLFVEPMAVVEINNELKELMGKEREEIERILLLLSALVARHQEEMGFSLGVMAHLDFVFAKAKLSAQMKAISPKIEEGMRLRIVQGRHPLIDQDKVVPSNFWMGEGFTTLIITGPNTGGKTVTLKTCGLFAVMAQAGLHIPAGEGSYLPIFTDVFADIGDEQSIEQSLSTFSSHMKNIVSILREVNERSLVLLDELGAGTDPTEGAALAISILERLTARGVLTLATTHYSELKAYALSTAGVENASVEFDVASLAPTYRLSIGIPGKSNAFEISRKLGLEAAVIDRAQEYLSQEQIRFEDVIQNAEYHRQLAEKEREQAELARRESERLKQQVQQERKRLEEQREKILTRAREEAARLIRKSKNEMDAIIGELKAQRDKAGAADRDRTIQQARDRMRGNERELEAAAPRGGEPADQGKPLTKVEVGQTVWVANLEKNGVVLSAATRGGEVQVQVGSMKLNAKLKNLRAAAQEEKKKPVIEKRESRLAMPSVGLELDIRGYDAESGVMEMDKYLDSAYMGGLKEVSIIHGKGTGILRDAVQRRLRRHPLVDTFRLGNYGEGETGVTIVKFKS